MQSPDPIVKPTPLANLRPTQMTVGKREVGDLLQTIKSPVHHGRSGNADTRPRNPMEELMLSPAGTVPG